MRRSSLDQWFNSARKGDYAKLKELINEKTSWNIDVRDDKARTALFLAVQSGHLRCIEGLLENGANPNRRAQFGSPAHEAIETRNIEALRLLLSYGAHLKMKNENNSTVLECANRVFGEKKVRGLIEDIGAQCIESAEVKHRNSSIKDRVGNVLITAPLPEVTSKEITCDNDDVYAEGPEYLYIKGKVQKDIVTLKKYKEAANDESVENLFFNEVTILSDLRHPNILLLMSACHGPPTADLCLVFEPVEQYKFLHKMIHVDHEQFNESIAIWITRDIACGLFYLHNRGIVHCYLGSHSVIINTQFKKTKICNFEYARRVHVGDSSDESISHLDALYGWMAPEQLQGMTADQQGDVYSFGVLVWEILSGKRPLHGTSNFKSLFGKEDHRIRKIPARWNGIMKQLVKDCLLPSKMRPNSAQVFEWLDGVYNNRLVHYRPAHLALEELPPLFHKTKPKEDKKRKPDN